MNIITKSSKTIEHIPRTRFTSASFQLGQFGLPPLPTWMKLYSCVPEQKFIICICGHSLWVWL